MKLVVDSSVLIAALMKKSTVRELLLNPLFRNSSCSKSRIVHSVALGTPIKPTPMTFHSAHNMFYLSH